LQNITTGMACFALYVYFRLFNGQQHEGLRHSVLTANPHTTPHLPPPGYVWDVEDVVRLRQRHRVFGVAVGSLVSVFD
jgi:hypothetical protein